MSANSANARAVAPENITWEDMAAARRASSTKSTYMSNIRSMRAHLGEKFPLTIESYLDGDNLSRSLEENMVKSLLSSFAVKTINGITFYKVSSSFQLGVSALRYWYEVSEIRLPDELDSLMHKASLGFKRTVKELQNSGQKIAKEGNTLLLPANVGDPASIITQATSIFQTLQKSNKKT
jgi:hypothetical protein